MPQLWRSAHRRALVAGEGGGRYAVVGPYLSYCNLGKLVASITGRPRVLLALPQGIRPLVVPATGVVAPCLRWRWPDLSRTLAAGGFLHLHVRGDLADRCFGLTHPPAIESIALSV